MATPAEPSAPWPAERARRWANFGKWKTVWFPQYLGLHLEELRTDYARMRLAYRPELRQTAGGWEGGGVWAWFDTGVVPGGGVARRRDCRDARHGRRARRR